MKIEKKTKKKRVGVKRRKERYIGRKKRRGVEEKEKKVTLREGDRGKELFREDNM